MKRLAALRAELEDAPTPPSKIDALCRYFQAVPAEDAVWGVYFALKGRLPRALSLATLQGWVAEASALPDWMIEECLDHGRDAAETFALLLPSELTAPTAGGLGTACSRPMELGLQTTEVTLGHTANPGTLGVLVTDSEALRDPRHTSTRKQRVWRTWGILGLRERVLWHELILGRPQLDCTRRELVDALARFACIPRDVIEQRLYPEWRPTPGAFEALCAPRQSYAHRPQSPTWEEAALLDRQPETLGEPKDWCCEWAWDGLAVRVVRSADGCVIWSFEGECLTHCFPELETAGLVLRPGTTLTGRIVAVSRSRPLPRAALQRRLSSRRPSGASLAESPILFMAHDLTEWEGESVLHLIEPERRKHLEDLIERLSGFEPACPAPSRGETQADLFENMPGNRATPSGAPGLIRLTDRRFPTSWAQADSWRSEARSRGAIGLLLKPRTQPAFGSFRRPETWVWLQDPHVARMVLVAARPFGRQTDGSFHEFSLAVWHGSELVPAAWVLATLPEAELDELQAFIHARRAARFGPVRAVEPSLVFEVAFLNAFRSPRHRCGCVLGAPRILRWLRKVPASSASTLQSLHALLEQS